MDMLEAHTAHTEQTARTARTARFDEEDQLRKLRTAKAQERGARLETINRGPRQKIVPSCWTMCPEFEVIDRQVTNDVSIFEASSATGDSGGRLMIDPQRAVKKFRRSAAGNYELAEDLRPPSVLLRTTNYLMVVVVGGGERGAWPGQPFSAVYAFVRDRLRAVRTDLTLQACRDGISIRIHELTIRFLIAAGHLLCEEERAVFEPQQNNEQLNGCLSALREMYKMARMTGRRDALENEAEFQSYAILLAADKKEAATAISALPADLLQSGPVRRGLECYAAYQQGNFVRFLALMSDPHTTYLQACLLHQFMQPLRQRALATLARLPPDSAASYMQLPTAQLSRWLGFVDGDECLYYAARFGFQVNVDTGTVNLSVLMRRGDAVDLRAEEETFRTRRFDAVIERDKRRDEPLVAIVFQGQLPAAEDIGPAAGFGGTTVMNGVSQQITNGFSQQITNGVNQASLNTVSAAPVVSDAERQQRLLKKRLEEQTAERKRRLEHIQSISELLLDALLDGAVTFNVAEMAVSLHVQLSAEHFKRREAQCATLAEGVFDSLLDEQVRVLIDVDLLRLRVRVAENMARRQASFGKLAAVLLNALEGEVIREMVQEGHLTAIADRWRRGCWLRRWRCVHNPALTRSSQQQLSHVPIGDNDTTSPAPFRSFSQSRLLLASSLSRPSSPVLRILHETTADKGPVHIVFVIGDGQETLIRSLLAPLVKRHPANPLSHLHSFLHEHDAIGKICMVWSIKPDFMLSTLETTSRTDMVELCRWPINFPAPTVLIHQPHITVNTTEFPLSVREIVLRVQSEGESGESDSIADGEDDFFLEAYPNGKAKDAARRLEELLQCAMQRAPALPKIDCGLRPSDLLSPSILKAFLMEPFDRVVRADGDSREWSDVQERAHWPDWHDGTQQNGAQGHESRHTLFLSLATSLVNCVMGLLFKCPAASALLTWHPLSAGRAFILDSMRKAPVLCDQFRNVLTTQLKTVASPALALQQTLALLDEAHGTTFATMLSLLHSTRAISELSRVQNETILLHLQRRDKQPTVTYEDAHNKYQPEQAMDTLRVRLRQEAFESEAYEAFLQRFL